MGASFLTFVLPSHPHSRPLPPPHALAPAPDPSPATNTTPATVTLPLDAAAGATLTAKVTSTPDGGVSITITAAGLGDRLLLHWGLVGGRDAAWRLPRTRPKGTLAYKKRALQTPFSATAAAAATVTITLPPSDLPPASAGLAFVVRDDGAGGEWLAPPGGGNFVAWLTDAPRASAPAPAAPATPAPTTAADPDLVAAWVLAAWQAAVCAGASPPPSAAADAAAELSDLLSDGVPPSTLADASASGAAYAAFWAARGGAEAVAAALPADLVGVQAYIMWEAAGRPDGADFGGAARRSLAGRVRRGESVDALRAALVPGAAPSGGGDNAAATAADAAAVADTPPPPSVTSSMDGDVLGSPAGGVPRVDALTLVNAQRGGDDGAATSAPPRPLPPTSPLAPLEAAASRERVQWHRSFGLGGGWRLLATVAGGGEGDGASIVTLTTDLPFPATLHWGVRASTARSKRDWAPPPDGVALPPGSSLAPGGGAADTPLTECDDEDCAAVRVGGNPARLARAALTIPPTTDVAALVFVLRADDGTRWWRDAGGNFAVPVRISSAEDTTAAAARAAAAASLGSDNALAAAIVTPETAAGAWTLMHRFNLAADLVEGEVARTRGDPGAAARSMATLFVWLRYSAARHLTWQRNYNTQPRLLGSAQDRLSSALAAAHAVGGEAGEWARACLSCVGRGARAQAVRDEILNIMHRHRIPEAAGTWMEQWHQKLHNNTTPDDVAICEAYIAFLEGGGDGDAYWRVLSSAGVTRARLAGFDRAITTDPQDFPDKRGALAADFRAYLSILKGVHSGADLAAAVAAAGDGLPAAARRHVAAVLSAGARGPALARAQHAVAARAALAPSLAGNRDLLYLDLALEAAARGAAERAARRAGAGAAALVEPLLANLALSTVANEDVCYALKGWQDAPASATAGRPATADDALRAAAAADRARRAVAAAADRVADAVTPIADTLGTALGVPDWARTLFAEEVVRGGPAFGASLALSAAEPALRAAASLSAWSVLSPGAAVGTLVTVDSLHDVADAEFDEATILIAARVSGEEDVPPRVVGVFTRDAPDVLSHLAVRARNGCVLLAGCYDAGPIDALVAAAGQRVAVSTTAAGDVAWRVADASDDDAATSTPSSPPLSARRFASLKPPPFCGEWAVPSSRFADGVVGAKSRNLAALRGRLPEWLRTPPSVTIPFGAFEAALADPANADAAARHAAALAALAGGARGADAGAALAAARAAALDVVPPAALASALEAQLRAEGVPLPSTPARWDAALDALKRVWASMYNERALLSMRKAGLPHGEWKRGESGAKTKKTKNENHAHTHTLPPHSTRRPPHGRPRAARRARVLRVCRPHAQPHDARRGRDLHRTGRRPRRSHRGRRRPGVRPRLCHAQGRAGRAPCPGLPIQRRGLLCRRARLAHLSLRLQRGGPARLRGRRAVRLDYHGRLCAAGGGLWGRQIVDGFRVPVRPHDPRRARGVRRGGGVRGRGPGCGGVCRRGWQRGGGADAASGVVCGLVDCFDVFFFVGSLFSFSPSPPRSKFKCRCVLVLLQQRENECESVEDNTHTQRQFNR